MIRFKAKSNDGKGNVQLGFGLTDTNLKRLKENQPIVVDLAEMGIPGAEIVIFYGKSEEKMYKEFKDKGFIGPDTKITPAKHQDRDHG